MASSISEILLKVLSSVYVSGGFPKMPDSSKIPYDNSRYYKCEMNYNNVDCIKLERDYHNLNNMKLISINNYIPEMFDKYIIGINLAKSVNIKNKNTA